MKNKKFLFIFILFGLFLYGRSAGFFGFVSAENGGAPGAFGIKIVNNRWPDTSSLKNFGDSAARIMGAQTEEEKAIALFRFIQQMTMIIGVVPREPVYGITDVVYPEKQLGVYGAHWCDGQSRLMEATWRALGGRGEKLYKFGHTLADIYYQDKDGIFRWHVFDNSAYHWFLYDRSGSHLATPEELALDQSLSARPSNDLTPAQTSLPFPSYIHSSHLKPQELSNLINLRLGEKVRLYWGNVDKPYYLPAGNDVGGVDFEHGPYEKTYGNAVWNYNPDFSSADYVYGLDGEAVNVKARVEDNLGPNIHPAEIGKTSALVYKFSYPYIISDASLSGTFIRKNPGDNLAISISNDRVKWKNIWSAESTGNISLSNLNINEKFDISGSYPADLITPFGHYDYYVKIEFSAAQNISDCGIENLTFETTTQHNIFSLPQLWPVDNEMTVSGNLSANSALRITYEWDDLQGAARRNIVELENLPYSYQIKADGTKWEDVRSKALLIEAVRQSGGGNRVIEKESVPLHSHNVSPREAFPTENIVNNNRWPAPPLSSTQQYISDIRDGLAANDFPKVHTAIFGLTVLRDPAAKQALLDVIYHDKSYKYYTRYYAIQALYQIIGAESLPVMVDILERDPAIAGWTDVTEEWDADSNWLWNCQIAAFILAQINNQEAKNNVGLIADLLDTAKLQQTLGGRNPSTVYRWSEIRWGLIKDIGILGGAEQVPLLLAEITPTWTGDGAPQAVRALGNIGFKDPAVISALKNLIHNAEIQGSSRMKILYSIEALGKLGSRQDAPELYKYLTDWDENMRGYAAIALGGLGNEEAIPYLENLLETESFSWVRQAAMSSISQLSGENTPPGSPTGVLVR
jgi:HEAT repeat protein